MRTFIILWLGQMASSVGSGMTYFALTLWVWQHTQSATAIALILVFYQLPQLFTTLISGVLVDRIPRKTLLILSDTGSAGCTIAVGILAAFHLLQLWHIYLIATIIGCFGNLQTLTYTTIVPLIVPKQHHTRAGSMGAMVGYGADIVSPAFAGLLYPTIGLLGITSIDLGTFAIAILTLLFVRFPHRQLAAGTQTESNSSVPGMPEGKTHNTVDDEQAVDRQVGGDRPRKSLWNTATFGFRYIASHPRLLAMVMMLSAFSFLNQMNHTLYQPLILLRTGDDTRLLGLVVAASGMGGVIGAIAISLWGGFRRRMVNIFVGFMGTGVSYVVFGLGTIPAVWLLTQFGVSFHGPLIMSSYMTVWYANVGIGVQGRVLAADSLIGIGVELSASAIAGVLADYVLEPAIQANRWIALTVGGIFGTEMGSGIALLIVINALTMIVLGLVGLRMRLWGEEGRSPLTQDSSVD